MTRARSRWLAVALVAVVAADWTTKFLIQNHLHLDASRTVVNRWVWLVHARNPGISFSFLRDLPELVRVPILALAALVGIGAAANLYRKTEDAGVRAAAGLVIAGAVGNLGDRLLNGWVTDFILVRYFPFVFNVADVAITVGAVLLAWRLLLERPHTGGGAPAQSEA